MSDTESPQIYGIHCKEFEIENVFTNHDYEPYAKVRDEEIKILLQKINSIQHIHDQVIFEKAK